MPTLAGEFFHFAAGRYQSVRRPNRHPDARLSSDRRRRFTHHRKPGDAISTNRP
jgi:hypothetical protein